MKRNFFLFVIILALFSCKKQVEKDLSTDWIKISDRVKMRESGNFLELQSGKFSYKIPHSKLPFRKIVFLNASLLGYVSELGQEEKIAGISSPEYIYSEKILSLIKSGNIQNVGNEQKYDVEKIISLKPDVIFTNRIESFENTYDVLRKNGIEIIFLDEYLEQNPLEKMNYLRVFGKLLGSDKGAALRCGEIASAYENLKSLVSKTSPKPIVISNEMYGNQWFMPGGKTFTAKLFADAGADYILKDNADQKAVPLSFEEVLAKSQNASFWVNAGNHHSKKELLAINSNYEKINPWKTGKIYAVTAKERGKANDFFESGVVRADLVLKDYIKIFHPEKLPNYRLTYMEPLP